MKIAPAARNPADSQKMDSNSKSSFKLIVWDKLDLKSLECAQGKLEKALQTFDSKPEVRHFKNLCTEMDF